MINNNRVVAVIPARGGSKGVPRKNIRILCGQPLISYNITAAKRSKYIDDVYVSTEDEEISEVSSKYGAKTVKRPKELASDTASSESALIHFAENVEFDILVFLQCTSPLTSEKDIDKSLELLISGRYDSILSACEDRGGFLCGGFTWTEDGKSINYDYTKRPRRQDLKRTLRENGAIYIMYKHGLLKNKNRLHGKVGIYEMSRFDSYEIDDTDDFRFLDRIFPYVFKNKQLENLKNTKMVIFDIDGVFTDGSVYVNSKGEESLKFSRIDGKGIELIRKKGIKVAVISSENNEAAKQRMLKLKTDEICLGVESKIEKYNFLKEKYKLNDSEICFCGDDLQDLELIKLAGVSCCPINSQEIIKKNSKYISNLKGGHGFVREICNLVLEHKGENS